MRRSQVLFALVLALALVSAACSKTAKKETAAEKKGEAAMIEKGSKDSFYLVADEQESAGTSVAVNEATLPAGKKGYVAIHSESNGTFGPVIGVSELLSSGDHKDLKIKLDKPLDATVNIWPMLHTEDNGNTSYDGANIDKPATDAGGHVVTFAVKITKK